MSIRLKRTMAAIAGAAFVSAMPAIVHSESVNLAPSVAQLLKKTPEANGIFVEGDEGAAQHVQSGLICPLTFPNLNLWHLEIFDKTGTDIGCDYGRQGSDNLWISKLTIYAVKAAPGDTVDAAFARYQSEVKGNYPQAKVTGPAIVFDGDISEDDKAVRSEEYDIAINGKHYQSDLVVTIKNGWVIEVRGTTQTDVATSDEAVNLTSDMALPYFALLQAQSTIGAK